MKSIAFIFILFCFGTFQSFSQITNGGFENWSDSIIYETPSLWSSSNQEMYYIETTVFKSTDTQEGTYAAKLGVAEIFGDTLGGFVLHGSLNPVTGIPYTDNFEAVIVNYKIDLQPGDSLYLILVRKSNGTIVDYQIKPFAFGPAVAWTPQIVPVGNITQDELLIGFIIGNPNTTHNPHPDSWALVDNIKLLNGGIYQANLPNYNFESWEDATVEIPDNWGTLNKYYSHFGINNSGKTSDAFEGTSAIEMSTILFGTDTIPGLISKGRIDFSSVVPYAPVPIASTPVNIAGAYKLTTTSIDEGILQIQFMENGSLVGYHEENFTPNSNYTIFNSVVGIFGTPDSIIFTVLSGDNPGTVLKLDALSFDSDLSIDSNSITDFTVSPNPADNSLHLEVKDSMFKKARIMTVKGEIVWETNSNIAAQTIDVSTFESGIYFISVTSEKGSSMKKVVIR
jgi:hypothetical protein